ncbi:hypothetical protein ACFPTO_07485 [Paraburkholderia denitrificans]|uniref:Uncharacterized protein n=1 Tax=Paraburkholderia denitrificans TaxID=694025 RepID=A0ABW0J6F6_9BURK
MPAAAAANRYLRSTQEGREPATGQHPHNDYGISKANIGTRHSRSRHNLFNFQYMKAKARANPRANVLPIRRMTFINQNSGMPCTLARTIPDAVKRLPIRRDGAVYSHISFAILNGSK